MTNTLHIKNELKQLTRLYAFLDQQAGTYELGELQSMQIKLALEEAVTNVIQYAYPDKKDQDIRIDMSYENKRLDNQDPVGQYELLYDLQLYFERCYISNVEVCHINKCLLPL